MKSNTTKNNSGFGGVGVSSTTTTRSLASIKLTSINEHFQCGICYGYITDATTITECLHSFCKPCIFHFFGTIDHRCPTCNTSVKDVNESIRADSRLQRLIYNMVPGLLKEELAKREKYFESVDGSDGGGGGLSLEEKTAAFTRDTWVNLKLYNEQMRVPTSDGSATSTRRCYVKYIQCLAATPVRIIDKLIRNKHGVPSNYKIKLTHEGQLLKDNETFIEVFTSFIVDKDEIFEVKYEIKKIKHRGRSSLKNIENKMQLRSSQSAMDMAVEPTSSTSRAHNSSSSTSAALSSSIKIRRNKNTTTTTKEETMTAAAVAATEEKAHIHIRRPLTADVEQHDRKRTSVTTSALANKQHTQSHRSINQLPSPTESNSSSSSSLASARLKNSDFLKVKFSRRSKKVPKTSTKSATTTVKKRKIEDDDDVDEQVKVKAQRSPPPPAVQPTSPNTSIKQDKEEKDESEKDHETKEPRILEDSNAGGDGEAMANSTNTSFETTREENILVLAGGNGSGDSGSGSGSGSVEKINQEEDTADENSSSSEAAKQLLVVENQTKEVVEDMVDKVEDSVQKDSTFDNSNI